MFTRLRDCNAVLGAEAQANNTNDGKVDKRKIRMVEAAGFEPVLPANTNPIVMHDFGFYNAKYIELACRFFSPPAPWSPPQS